MKDFRKFFRSRKPYRMTMFDDYVKNYQTPYVTKETDLRTSQTDIFSELMTNRIIFFGDEFNSDTCNIVLAQLLWLNQQNPEADIDIYINSPGGSVVDCFALLSTMEAISNDIRTTAVGMAASCANLLLVSGTAGKRQALPLSKLLIHQPMGGARGQATDIEIEAKFILELKEDIVKIYMKHTGLSHDEIWQGMDRNNWVRPENAIPGKDWGKLGMIDRVISKI